MSASNEINKVPLPPVKPASGLRIPHDRANFLQTNYKLRTDLYSGGNVRKTDTKTTAAEMLEASRKIEIEDNVYTQSDQIMGNSMDFDFDIDNRPNSQENIVENCKEEPMESMESQTYESRPYSNIGLDNTIEKQLNDL